MYWDLCIDNGYSCWSPHTCKISPANNCTIFSGYESRLGKQDQPICTHLLLVVDRVALHGFTLASQDGLKVNRPTELAPELTVQR